MVYNLQHYHQRHFYNYVEIKTTYLPVTWCFVKITKMFKLL